MLRAFSFSLLSIGLLAGPTMAQTSPSHNKTTKTTHQTASRRAPGTSHVARAAAPADAKDGTGQSGYAAPGEPLTPTSSNGKNTPPYDGPAARPARANTTLTAPK